jgi:hypothetical protein
MSDSALSVGIRNGKIFCFTNLEFISEAMGDRGNLLTLDSKVSTQFKGEKTHQNWMQNKNSVYHSNYLM